MARKIIINTEAENSISVFSKEGTRMYYATSVWRYSLAECIKYLRTLPKKDMILKWKIGFDCGQSALSTESIDDLESFLKQ